MSSTKKLPSGAITVVPRRTDAAITSQPKKTMFNPQDLPNAAIEKSGALEQTSYVWNSETDENDWAEGAERVLSVGSLNKIATGSAFNLLVAPEHVTRRQQLFDTTNVRRPGKPIPYEILYRILPGGPRSRVTLWLEEKGQWWPNDRGRPHHAQGTIRVLGRDDTASQTLAPANDLDELTGQLNRIRLTSALEAVIQRIDATGKPCAFLVAAINNVAIINETFGFDVGDHVIATVAKTMRSKLRGGDTIGRYSSNKFGIVLTDCGPGAMRIAAERLIKAVGETRIGDTLCPLSATLSVGGVTIPHNAANVSESLNHALEALDIARAKRQDCFVSYERNAEKENARRRNIEVADEVSAALEKNRLKLVLQPIVSSKTRQPAYYECLLRMERPNGELISAGQFMEIAEQLGLSRQLDRRTLDLTVDLLKTDPDLRLSVNVSGLTCADHDWLLALHKHLSTDPSIAPRLTVEITETAAIEDLEQSIVFVDNLKAFGCRVAIDDFGAGYTSFKNLKHLAADVVKIDGSFVRNLVQDDRDRLFLRMMVDLARSFEMQTVAEWVIDEPTARIVAETGITHMQGYHVGKPMDPSTVSPRFAASA